MQIIESCRKDYVIRRRALLNLGRCEDQATVEAVRELVREYHPFERRSASTPRLRRHPRPCRGRGISGSYAGRNKGAAQPLLKRYMIMRQRA